MLYLIQTYGEDYSLLKIGFSDNLENRLGQYLDCNPLIKILKIREGGKDLESYLHRYFSKYKYPEKREWFYYSGEIVEKFDKINLPSKDELTIESILSKTMFKDRLKLFYEFWKENPDNIYLIPKEYQEYINSGVIETSLRRSVLDKKKIKKEYKFKLLSDKEVLEFIYNSFEIGKVYTKKEVKKILNMVISNVEDYRENILLKSTDITLFFNIGSSKLIDPISNKSCNAIKILSIKEN